MARNRVIYQSQAVYASTAAFDDDLTEDRTISGLQRVQSANYSFNIARQDVNQFGQLAAIDRIITDAPTVSFDTSYYVANFTNERTLGFTIAPSGASISQFKSAVTDLISTGEVDSQKNYFILFLYHPTIPFPSPPTIEDCLYCRQQDEAYSLRVQSRRTVS